MKESKGVYVTKRTMKQDFQRACGYDNKMKVKQLIASCEVKRFTRATQEMGCQADVKKDLGCTCRLAGIRHLNERYFNAAEQIYTYHGLRSFTNTGVGSIRALQRKRVRKIYLPETMERGVGDNDLSSSLFRKTNCTCGSNYVTKETSSKCVGGVLDRASPVVNVKLSPIVKCNCVTTGSEMPWSSEDKNIEISTQGTYTEDKKYIATTTQVLITPTVADAPVDPISIPNAAKEVKEMPKEPSKSRQRNKTLAAKAKAREEEKFSSDSLVQHIHDLECPSKISRPSDDPVMENKIEREYRQIFATKSKSNQDQLSHDNRNTSLLRRRFEALRRGRKKEEPRNTVELVSSSPTSLASHKDVSIASDPPSLEARSYSRPSDPYKTTASPTYDRTSYRRSVTGKKEKDSLPSIEDDNDINQGVSGMFRLWGKKFNLDDQKKTVKADDTSKTEESVDYITGDAELPPTDSKEKKTGGRKFSFFNKRSKDKTKSSYKSRKGMTTNRCEVKNGLLLKIAGTSKPQGNAVAETKKLPEAISPEKYDETLRKAWLKRFLTSSFDSRDSVKIRWNNASYTTSSSTVFELMDNVYKHTGVVIRSKSDITTNKSKKSNNKKVNFIHQNIEAWMMPKTIPDRPMLIPTKMKSTPDKGDTKSIEVSLPDQKWSIDTAKTFSHKIELVLHSNNVVQLTNKVSSDFLRIDIPKGFFSDSTTGDEQDHHCRTSDEEVYKIVEYETLKSNSDFRKQGNFDTGDHASNEITVTVKVKDSQNVESKVLETVIKRQSTQRDVVTQGSDVYFPKRCDVIGVGIITQRDVREMKPILNIQDNLSEDESDPTTYSHKKNCEFAQSCLQGCYRDLVPQGIDLFSWCIDDSNVKICCSEKNSAITLNHGDGSKSCPNIYEELNAAATEFAIEVGTEVSSDMALSSHGGTNFDEEIYNKSKIFYGRLCKEKRPKEKCTAADKSTCEAKCKPSYKRVFPKDSMEVFKKRKIYAVSQKRSKWDSCSNSQGGSLPSLQIKPCTKAVPKKPKCNSKHVIVTQPCGTPPEPTHSPNRGPKASCSDNSCPSQNYPTSGPICQSSLPPCPNRGPLCPPEPPCGTCEPSLLTNILSNLFSKPPCPPSEPPCSPRIASILSNLFSKPHSPGDCPHSNPPCPPREPPCLPREPPCTPREPPCTPREPPCPPREPPCPPREPHCPPREPHCPPREPPCPPREPHCPPREPHCPPREPPCPPREPPCPPREPPCPSSEPSRLPSILSNPNSKPPSPPCKSPGPGDRQRSKPPCSGGPPSKQSSPRERPRSKQPCSGECQLGKPLSPPSKQSCPGERPRSKPPCSGEYQLCKPSSPPSKQSCPGEHPRSKPPCSGEYQLCKPSSPPSKQSCPGERPRSKTPCSGEYQLCKPSSPPSKQSCPGERPRSKPPCSGECHPTKPPSKKPPCLACRDSPCNPPVSASYGQIKSPCPALVPLCLLKKRLSNIQPALKKPSSHDSNDTSRINKISINTNSFEMNKGTKLKCNKPAFPILPCTSPPSLCAAVTPASPSEADSPASSKNASKYNLIIRRCHTPPPPNVDPKMRSISPLTSLLNCRQDMIKNKKRLCSILGCNKSPINYQTPKATENKKSGTFDCEYCKTPPCTEETDTSTSSENEGSPQTAPTVQVVSPSESSCHCCTFSPPLASPPCLLKGKFPKQLFTPPSFPLIRQFAANRLTSQPSLTTYPPCFTDRSVAKQSSSPCSLPANRQCTENQLVPCPSFLPYHSCTTRPISPPSCPSNCQFTANQLASSPSSPAPDKNTNRSVSPPSILPNNLNFLPPKCQLALNKLASRSSSLNRIASPPSSSRGQYLKQQSTSPSPPNLPCTQESHCPSHDESTSYIIIRKSVFPTSAPPDNESVSLSHDPPSTPIPKLACKECSSPGVMSSNQTDAAAEYPPLIQSYSTSISKCCSQSAVTDTNRSTPACVSNSSKQDCPCVTTPPLQSPRASQNMKSKITGLFLRKLPSIKKTKARPCCDDGKHYNIKVNEHSSDSHSGIREMKLQDEDGLTLCERTEYTKRSRSIHRPSVAGDVFETANICHRVSTTTSELKLNSNSKQCIVPDDSSPSLANLVEIQFKMKVTQGDKVTEINIGNGDDSEKDKITKVKPDIYVVNKASKPVTVGNNPGNDIDIRIVIKNFKSKNKKVTRKIKKESVIDEFTRKISEKFHTVSTGYSDIVHSDADPIGDPSNAFSAHRATWDLTCQSDDKEKAGKISELSDYTDKEATIINTNTSLSAVALTESIIKDEEIAEKPAVQEKSCISINLSVIQSDVSKHEEGEPNVVTDDTDQSTGVELGIISSSDTTRREKTPKAQKKKMLKMVIEKAGRLKHKNKDKVSKITRMLKTILTSDSSDHADMTIIKNNLAKDITYASLPPNVLRDTDSMNNFFKISGMFSDNEDKCDRLNTSRDTVTSYADEPPVSKTCGGAGGGCLCNKVATKLGLSDDRCCCQSKLPQKADMETNCDLRTDEDMFLLNYGTSSFIDQETQRSRLFCSKANSVNVTFFKSVLSNELDIFSMSEVKNFSSNNLEKSSQEETKMIKKTSTPEALDNVLNLADEDKIIIANMEPTKYKIETVYTEVTHRKEPKEKVRLDHVVPADILQSYETKKAVLEMYTERTLSKEGERLVAKLPKFSLENESDIIKYEKICTRSLIFSLKR